MNSMLEDSKKALAAHVGQLLTDHGFNKTNDIFPLRVLGVADGEPVSNTPFGTLHATFSKQDPNKGTIHFISIFPDDEPKPPYVRTVLITVSSVDWINGITSGAQPVLARTRLKNPAAFQL